jgi:DNA-binding MarR family transcriptional regulator
MILPSIHDVNLIRRRDMTIQTFARQLQAVDIGATVEGEGNPPAVNAGRRYCELTAMLDRLHRRYLDVVRLELEEIGVRDVNPSQALMLTMVNDGDVPLRDIMQRGGYTASTATYMIKKLVEHGYLEQARAAHDRRTMRLRLTRAGRRVTDHLVVLNSRHAEYVGSEEGLSAEIADTTATLRRIDRVWTEFLTFG